MSVTVGSKILASDGGTTQGNKVYPSDIMTKFSYLESKKGTLVSVESGVYLVLPATYTITKNVNPEGAATISGPDDYEYSDSAQIKTFAFTPASGSNFLGWEATAGSFSGNDLTIPAKYMGNITITGNFSRIIYSITLTNPKGGLVFTSITGNLYSDSNCTALCMTNTKYTGTTFYYTDNAAPIGSYIYDYGSGKWEEELPLSSDMITLYNSGALTTLLGSSGTAWTGTVNAAHAEVYFVYIDLSTGNTGYISSHTLPSISKSRCMQLSF